MATLAVTNSFSAGTTIVAADMNENFDDIEAFINTTPGVVQEDIIDAVGDIIHGDAADSVAKLAVGTNDHCLVADSTVSNVGLKWAVPTDTTKLPLAGGTMSGETIFADQLATKPMLKDYSELTAANAASGTAATIDLVAGNVHTVAMTGNCTFTFSNPIAGDDCSSFTLILTQDGSGSRTATWPASVDWPGGSAPTLTTTATTGRDMLMFVTVDGGTTWLGSSLLDFS